MRVDIPNLQRPRFETIFEIGNGDFDNAFTNIGEFNEIAAETRGYDRRFETYELSQVIDPDSVSEFLYNFSKDISLLTYSYKEDHEITVMSEKDPELEVREVTEDRSVNIFLHNSGYVFVNGYHKSISQGEALSRYIFQEHKLTEVLFEPEFLLWMVYRNKEAKPLDSNLTLQRITEAEIAAEDRGPQNYVLQGDEPQGIFSDSLHFLSSIYANDNLTKIEGEFELFGYDVSAIIDLHQGIQVVPSLGSLSDANESKRLLLSLRFCIKIIEVFSDWLEMDEQDRIPPRDFYDDIQSEVEKSDSHLTLTENRYPFDYESDPIDPERLNSSEADILNEDIDKLLLRGETETIEFKEELPGHLNNIAKEATALANSQGGILIFGISDEGDIIGLDNVRDDEETVMNILSENVQPPLETGVSFESVNNSDILVLRIPQYKDLPHSADYTFYIRRGTTKRKLSSYELSYLMPDRSETE